MVCQKKIAINEDTQNTETCSFLFLFAGKSSPEGTAELGSWQLFYRCSSSRKFLVFLFLAGPVIPRNIVSAKIARSSDVFFSWIVALSGQVQPFDWFQDGSISIAVFLRVICCGSDMFQFK